MSARSPSAAACAATPGASSHSCDTRVDEPDEPRCHARRERSGRSAGRAGPRLGEHVVEPAGGRLASDDAASARGSRRETTAQVGDDDGRRLDAFGAERRLEIGERRARGTAASRSIRSTIVSSSRRAAGSSFAASTQPVGGMGSARSAWPICSSGVIVVLPPSHPTVAGGVFLPGSSTSRSRVRQRAIRLAIVPDGSSSSAEIVR